MRKRSIVNMTWKILFSRCELQAATPSRVTGTKNTSFPGYSRHVTSRVDAVWYCQICYVNNDEQGLGAAAQNVPNLILPCGFAEKEPHITYGSLTTLLITCLPQHCWRIYVYLYANIYTVYLNIFVLLHQVLTTDRKIHQAISWVGFVKNNSVDTDVYLLLSNRLVW